jgi:hypothetical protein
MIFLDILSAISPYGLSKLYIIPVFSSVNITNLNHVSFIPSGRTLFINYLAVLWWCGVVAWHGCLEELTCWSSERLGGQSWILGVFKVLDFV